MLSPGKIVDSGPEVTVEKDKTEKLKNLIQLYGETFCETSVNAINVASKFPGKEQGQDFVLPQNTFVSHQGLTIFSLEDKVYITRNPLALDEIKNAGLKENPFGSGTPLVNADLELVARQMPYIASFLTSSSANETNQTLERNRKVGLLDKESKYLDDATFQEKYGFTKEEYTKNKYESGFLNNIII